MSPSPRNPSLGMKLDCTRFEGRGTNRVDPWRSQSVTRRGCCRERLVNAGRQGRIYSFRTPGSGPPPGPKSDSVTTGPSGSSVDQQESPRRLVNNRSQAHIKVQPVQSPDCAIPTAILGAAVQITSTT